MSEKQSLLNCESNRMMRGHLFNYLEDMLETHVIKSFLPCEWQGVGPVKERGVTLIVELRQAEDHAEMIS